jgi:hypothetical protein
MRIKKQNGQVAIFVAIVFQILFVFFAMVINVGLLVHHKINLQNSVDLAAYYGAMKQAEALNLIGHVNYQIRQSFKLLTFRYRHLGMMGDASVHPFDITRKVPRGSADLDRAWVVPPASLKVIPHFCFVYPPLATVKPDENQCKSLVLTEGGRIRTVQLPSEVNPVSTPIDIGIGGVIGGLNQITQTIRKLSGNRCREASAMNFLMLSLFITGYKKDIANRKKLIHRIASDISKPGSQMIDIDGQEVRLGAINTLKNNLTHQNLRSFVEDNFEFENGISGDQCGGGGGDYEMPKWLKEIYIQPLFSLVDPVCDTDRAMNPSLDYQVKLINSEGNNQPNYPPSDVPIARMISQMSNFVRETNGSSSWQRLINSSMGFEKDPWCVAYVKVKAKTQPKIPFLPFSEFAITAEAYAKPFGGTIGPWDKNGWSKNNSEKSDGPAQIDEVRPPRRELNQIFRPPPLTDPASVRMFPDHARYVGDTVGTGASGTVFRYAHAVLRPMVNQNFIDYDWWSGLFLDISNLQYWDRPNSTNDDILAWDRSNSSAPYIRQVEVAAIAPDQFDQAYYSIEPNFYRTYYHRLKKRESEFGFQVRLDLGGRLSAQSTGAVPWGIFSVKHQIELANQELLTPPTPLVYLVPNWFNLLTSFQTISPNNHILDTNRFGRCTYSVDQRVGGPLEKANTDINREMTIRQESYGTTGDCIQGGRLGYSVKLVDPTHLRQSSRNPPP